LQCAIYFAIEKAPEKVEPLRKKWQPGVKDTRMEVQITFSPCHPGGKILLIATYFWKPIKLPVKCFIEF
jgi:hypothetical protein